VQQSLEGVHVDLDNNLFKCIDIVVYEYLPETTESITWTKHYTRCNMCIQWTRVLYCVVITRQSNPHISQFSRPCNESTSVSILCIIFDSYVPQTKCVLLMRSSSPTRLVKTYSLGEHK